MITPATHRVLYLAGPVTGQPNGNRPVFAAAAMRLRHQGFTVVNPHELGLDLDTPWTDAMRECVAVMVRARAVAVLPGWQRSRGAAIEVQLARALEMDVVDAHTLEDALGGRRRRGSSHGDLRQPLRRYRRHGPRP